jgi:hypothetical protein
MKDRDRDRRKFIGAAALGLGGLAAEGALAGSGAKTARKDPIAPYRTPYKYQKLVLAGSGVKGTFDEKLVDCPFVFSRGGRFGMPYVGWDGTGYQTGLATSTDLKSWKRHPASPLLRNGPKSSPDDCFASDPAVLRHERQWAIYYFGLSTDGFRATCWPWGTV